MHRFFRQMPRFLFGEPARAMVTTTYPLAEREQSNSGLYIYSPPCVNASRKTETIVDSLFSSASQISEGQYQDQSSASFLLPPSVLRQQRRQGNDKMRNTEGLKRAIPTEQRDTVDDDVSQQKSTREPSQALVDEIINNLSGLWHPGEEDVTDDDGSSVVSGSTSESDFNDLAETQAPGDEQSQQRCEGGKRSNERGKKPRMGFGIIQAGVRALSPGRKRLPAPWSDSQFPTSFASVNCLTPSASSVLPTHRGGQLPSSDPGVTEHAKSAQAILDSIKSVEAKIEEMEQQQRCSKSSHVEPGKRSMQPSPIDNSEQRQQSKTVYPLSSSPPSNQKGQSATPENLTKSQPTADGVPVRTSAAVAGRENTISFPGNNSYIKTATLESTVEATEVVLDDLEQELPSLKHRIKTVACWNSKKSLDPAFFALATPRPKSETRNPKGIFTRSRRTTKPAPNGKNSKIETNKATTVRPANEGREGLKGPPKTVTAPTVKYFAPASQAVDPLSGTFSSKLSVIDDKPSTLATMISSVQSSLSFTSSLEQLSEPTQPLPPEATKPLSNESQSSFPVMRIVSDGFSDTKLLVQGSRDFMIGAPDVMFTPTSGSRQSIILYEYDTGSHAAVVYDEFGDDPRSLLEVEEFNVQPQPRESAHEVLIKVEASTVSRADCAIRQGEWWRTSNIPLPNIPGVDIVGRIHRIDKRTAAKFHLREGDRVAALTRWGGNSRYACVPAKLLVKVPGNLDPGKSVCLPETYLSAFQAIHYGQPESTRYAKDSLAGKAILIVEGYTNVGLAAISLAADAGAVVYTTAKEKHFQELTRLGAIPLTRDPFDWLPLLGERMDMVIAVGGVYSDSEEPANHYHLRALREGGCLVLVGDPGDQWIPKLMARSAGSIGCVVGMTQNNSISTHKYNVFEQWADDLEVSKRDLLHLLRLLQNGVFNPKIIDRVPLSRVPKAQELIQDKSHNGIIVCEPWIRSKHRSVLL